MKRSVSKKGTLLQLRANPAIRVAGHRVGHVVEVHGKEIVVDYPGNPHGPLVARATLAVAASPRVGDEVLLIFEDECSERPIVIGLLAPATRAQGLEARVDGARVVLDATEEIVLRCGKASITLRKNGRVVVRGTHVETRSDGVNRVKGTSVQIN